MVQRVRLDKTTDRDDFVVVGDDCAGTKLGPAEECTFGVRFAPVDGPQPAMRTARLWLDTDRGTSPSVTLQGEAGALPSGPKGDPGTDGTNGHDGAVGHDGAAGADGPAGASGKDGLNGPAGKDGTRGEKGDKGDNDVYLCTVKGASAPRAACYLRVAAPKAATIARVQIRRGGKVVKHATRRIGTDGSVRLPAGLKAGRRYRVRVVFTAGGRKVGTFNTVVVAR